MCHSLSFAGRTGALPLSRKTPQCKESLPNCHDVAQQTADVKRHGMRQIASCIRQPRYCITRLHMESRFVSNYRVGPSGNGKEHCCHQICFEAFHVPLSQICSLALVRVVRQLPWCPFLGSQSSQQQYRRQNAESVFVV